MSNTNRLQSNYNLIFTVAFVLLLVLAMVTTAIGTAYFIWKNKPVARVECIERVI